MGLLDSIVGSLGGALQQGTGQPQGRGRDLSPLVAAIVQMVANQPGGLAGMLQSFQRKGLGDAVSSWVSTGPNLPVSPDQVQGALGDDVLAQLARQLGMPVEGAAAHVAEALPQIVDHATPQGRLPQEGEEDPLGSLLKSFGG